MEINAVRIKEAADMLRKDALQVETCFKKHIPYIMDLTFSKHDFQKGGEQVIVLLKLIELFSYYIFNGIVRIKFKYYY